MHCEAGEICSFTDKKTVDHSFNNNNNNKKEVLGTAAQK
jgi:hypothetical protein